MNKNAEKCVAFEEATRKTAMYTSTELSSSLKQTMTASFSNVDQIATNVVAKIQSRLWQKLTLLKDVLSCLHRVGVGELL